MNNPFENANGSYCVLMNREGQYSLWPSFLDIPGGWSVAYKEGGREQCLDYINAHWTDLAPHSLKEKRQEE